MLATRIIPLLLNKRGALVKGRGFNKSRVVGHTLQAIRVFQARNVDELILLDVSGDSLDVGLTEAFASDCFMPLTVGGGVRTLDDFAAMIANGADKVAINTAAIETPELITEASRKFGSQAVTVSIDVRNGTVWINAGRRDTGRSPVDVARSVEALGAGEILVNRIERDGTLQGYDLDLVRSVAGSVSIPVVAAGGAGSYEHLKQGLEAGAHAVAAGAMWTFTDATPQGAAEYLAQHGFAVRHKLAA